ncbi:MAG TPA: hypothetical protein VF170_19265, partial [Planctomycetaceae bacterium]
MNQGETKSVPWWPWHLPALAIDSGGPEADRLLREEWDRFRAEYARRGTTDGEVFLMGGRFIDP